MLGFPKLGHIVCIGSLCSTVVRFTGIYYFVHLVTCEGGGASQDKGEAIACRGRLEGCGNGEGEFDEKGSHVGESSGVSRF